MLVLLGGSGGHPSLQALAADLEAVRLKLSLAQEQGNSDSVLDDVACLLSCTRTSLHGGVFSLLSAAAIASYSPEAGLIMVVASAAKCQCF